MSDSAYVLKNAARCLRCRQVVESTHRREFMTCGCGNLSVDGGRGHTQPRRVYGDFGYEEMLETSRETRETRAVVEATENEAA